MTDSLNAAKAMVRALGLVGQIEVADFRYSAVGIRSVGWVDAPSDDDVLVTVTIHRFTKETAEPTA